MITRNKYVDNKCHRLWNILGILCLIFGSCSNPCEDSFNPRQALNTNTSSEMDVLVVTPEIRLFAIKAIQGESSQKAQAQAIYHAILDLIRQGAITRVQRNVPQIRIPKTAAELLDNALSRKRSTLNFASCFDLSALFVVSARSIGLSAVGVEQRKRDGIGQIGHIMVGVRLGPEERLLYFDLQNEKINHLESFRVLNDQEFAAHFDNHVAVAAYLQQDFTQALYFINRALTLAPQVAGFLNNKATIRAARSETWLALADIVHAVECAPQVPLYRYQMGRLFLRAGQYSEAIDAFIQALSLRPTYALALRDLGWTYALMHKYTSAISYITKVVHRYPRTPYAHLYLACLYIQIADFHRAQEAIGVGLRYANNARELKRLEHAISGSEVLKTDDSSRHLLQNFANGPLSRSTDSKLKSQGSSLNLCFASESRLFQEWSFLWATD